MRPPLVVMLAVLSMLGGCTTATAAPPVPAAFVPASALVEGANEELVRQALAQIAAADPSRCYESPEYDFDAPDNPADFTLTSWLARAPVVLVGRVASTSAGWHVQEKHVMTAVELTQLEVLRDTTGVFLDRDSVSLLENSASLLEDSVSLLEDFGSIAVAGRTLCAVGLHERAEVGQTLLIAGSADAATPGLLTVWPSSRFRIETGHVLLPENLPLLGTREMKLDELRKQFGR